MDFSASAATKDAARTWRRRSCTLPRFSSTLPHSLVTTLLVWRSRRQRGLASRRAPGSYAMERANLTAKMLAQPAERFPERFPNAALRRLLPRCPALGAAKETLLKDCRRAVSYTHLTLPTILRV